LRLFKKLLGHRVFITSQKKDGWSRKDEAEELGMWNRPKNFLKNN
jgi:hypothetical protein